MIPALDTLVTYSRGPLNPISPPQISKNSSFGSCADFMLTSSYTLEPDARIPFPHYYRHYYRYGHRVL
jgi:hypothetical protein